MRLQDQLFDATVQHLVATRVDPGDGALDERALPDPGADDTLALQTLDGTGRRVAVDPGLDRQVANRRETVAGLQRANSDQPPQLVGDLLIQGNRAAGVGFDHLCPTVIGQYTPP